MGGVTRSVYLTEKRLIDSGVSVRVVDYGRVRSALGALTMLTIAPATVSVVNVSGLRRFATLARLGLRAGKVSILFLHGGQIPAEYCEMSGRRRRTVKRLLRRADMVWCTNDSLAVFVRSRGAERVELVSPMPSAPSRSASAPSRSAGHPRRSGDAAVFAYLGAPLYGVEVAVDAVRGLREDPRPLLTKLHVVFYGGATADTERLARMLAPIDWVEVHRDLRPEEVATLLSSVAILLRPSQTDGDAMLVREALALGTRVIASSCVPRPAGVEICEPTADALSDAVRSEGTISDGSGLGVPADVALLNALAISSDKRR
jgi:glycosyltransferase involved in cell wall biosynthesis